MPSTLFLLHAGTAAETRVVASAAAVGRWSGFTPFKRLQEPLQEPFFLTPRDSKPYNLNLIP